MHRTPGRTGGVIFFHNGDFSGTLEIVVRDGLHWEYNQKPVYEFSDPIPPPGGWNSDREKPKGYHCLRIPFRDVKGIVAKYVRQQHIEKLENMSDDEVLSLINIADKIR